jgi:hypothetical protein
MVALTWLRGLLAHRRSRLVSTALGVAIGVALLASIGTFLSSTTSQMTGRAVSRVAVDWQVEAQNGAKPADVLATVRHQPGVTRALPVTFAATTGLPSTDNQEVMNHPSIIDGGYRDAIFFRTPFDDEKSSRPRRKRPAAPTPHAIVGPRKLDRREGRCKRKATRAQRAGVSSLPASWQ